MSSQIEALSSARALASGIGWNALGRGLPVVVALVTTPFLLHHLGIERWALFTLALSVAGSFGILDFGIGAALTRALAERIGTPAERESAPIIVVALTVLVLTGSVGAALAWVATPWAMQRFLHVPPALRPEAIDAFRVLCLSGPLIIVNSALWGVLSAFQKFRVVILSNIPVSILYYAGPTTALLVSHSFVLVIATLVAARLMQAAICGAIVLRLVPDLRRRPRLELRLLRPLLRIGAWVTVSNILWPLMLYVDRFVVGTMLPLAAVSYYATSLDLVVRLMMVPLAISAVLFPAVATSYRTMPERACRLLRHSLLPTVAVVFPACVLLTGFARELLSLWLGAGFANDSQTIVVIFAVGTFLSCIAQLPGTLTDAAGRPEIGAIILLVQAVLFPPIIVLMIWRFDITGAAVTWMLRAAINFAVRLLVCRQLGAMAAPIVPGLWVVGIIGVTALAACWLTGPVPLRVAVMASAAIGVPLLAGALLLDASEIAQVRQAMRRSMMRLLAARPAWLT